MQLHTTALLVTTIRMQQILVIYELCSARSLGVQVWTVFHVKLIFCS